MFCPNCGKKLTDDAIFCSACGQPVNVSKANRPEASRAQEPDKGPEHKSEPDSVAEPEAEAAEKPQGFHASKRSLVVIVVIAALLVSGVGGYLWWRADQQQKAAAEADRVAHTDHDVTVAVSVPGYDDASSSGIPLRVTGTDLDGTSVDQVFYVDSHGVGIVLKQGTYEASAAGSPFLADGTIFAVPGDTHSIAIGSDAGDGTAVDLSSQASFSFTALDALSVSDDQIESAYELAKAGGATSDDAAQALKDAATKRRDDAVAAKRAADEAAAQKAAEEAAAAEKAKWHVSTSRYEFDLPEYWHDKVSVQVSEGGSTSKNTTVSVYSTKYPDELVCSLYINDDFAKGEPVGDFSGYQLEAYSISANSAIIVHFDAYLAIALDEKSRPVSYSDTLPDEETLYLEDLRDQGAEDYDAMADALSNDDKTFLTRNSNLDFDQFKANVVPTIVLK